MKPSLWLGLVISVASVLSAQTNSKPAKKAAAAKTAVSVADVNALRDALAAQQKQMEAQRQQMDQLKSQLQQLLDASQQTNAAAQKVQSNAEQAQTTAAQAQQSAAEAQRLADQAAANAVEAKTALSLVNSKTQDEDKKISALQDILGRFRFSGDVRVRGESFFQDCPTCLDRNRARVRVRLGVDGKLSEDFVGGIMLASGSLGDSNSTNETLTNFFTRKTIGIDRAYVTYQPIAHRWISLTGGKFAFTWQRTPITFDSDLNPEGFSEKFSFDLDTPVVKNFTVQGIQLLYSENNSSKFITAHDSFAAGGQISAKLALGIVTSTPSYTLLNWRSPDAILNASGFAVQSPGEGPGCAGGFGLPTAAPCVYSPQGFTNATFTDANGKIHYLSQFLYSDFILNNQIKTPWNRFPANLVLEYEDNLNAADHPLDSTGNVLSNLGKQSHAYMVDFSLGQIKNKNDVQFGYGWWRQEQDSTLSSFVESEQREPTNVIEHRIYALWKLRPNTVAMYNLWIGRALNSNLEHAVLAPGTTLGQTEPYVKRMQFDLLYSF